MYKNPWNLFKLLDIFFPHESDTYLSSLFCVIFLRMVLWVSLKSGSFDNIIIGFAYYVSGHSCHSRLLCTSNINHLKKLKVRKLIKGFITDS